MSKNFRELLVAKGLLGGKYGKKETEERSREDPKEKRLREESDEEGLREETVMVKAPRVA